MVCFFCDKYPQKERCTYAIVDGRFLWMRFLSGRWVAKIFDLSAQKYTYGPPLVYAFSSRGRDAWGQSYIRLEHVALHRIGT